MTFAPAYCASKHGVVGFSRSMTACATSHSVRVNCICPEFVRTAMVTEGLGLSHGDTRDMVNAVGLME